MTRFLVGAGPERDRPVRIGPARHPFEVMALASALVCGIVLAVVEGSPPSVSAVIPGDLEPLWEFGLVAVGIVGLLGLGWPGRLGTALGVELGGLVGLGAVTGMYAIALAVTVGTPGIVAASFTAAVAVAAWWRGVQIIRDLGRLARPDQADVPVDVPVLVERDPP